jgi:uncharacterized protein YjiK
MRSLSKSTITVVRLLLAIIIPFLSIWNVKPVVLAQAQPHPFKEIRTVYTAEFGAPHPTGVTFLPQASGFMLWGAQSDTREVQLVSNYEDSAGSLALPVNVENPLSVAFDSQSNSLFALNNGGSELVQIGIDEKGLPDAAAQNVNRYNARAYGIQNPVGMTFDPISGRLFILDSKGPRMVSIQRDPANGFDGDMLESNGKISRLDVAGLNNIQLRGLTFNPQNAHFYAAAPDEQKIFEYDQTGQIISTLDLTSLQLTNIQALTFAPSADRTDDPATMDLFVLDSGVSETRQTSSGQILELSLAPESLPPGTTLLGTTLVRTFSTSNTVWNPSSPDPSGIDYWPPTGGFIIDDSEVDEMSNYFTGKNVFLSTLSGTLTGTCSTTNLSRSGFSNEPTGIAVNQSNNHIFISDDDARKVFEVMLGADGQYCTSDDAVVSVATTTDTEDVAYGNNTLFISGGTDAEVFMFSLGADGQLGGGDDGPVTHFDTAALGFSDLEGIDYNDDTGTLFIVSTSTSDRYLGEVTTSGALLHAYDLSFMGTAYNSRSDVSYAPSSQNPNTKNIYIVSRGVDNNTDPNENDGKVWEVSLSAPATQTPTDTATATKTVTPTFTTTPVSTNPFYVSFASNGTVAGVSFADEDVLKFNGQTWSLFFDGSDVGVGGSDLFAFGMLDADSLLMSFGSAVTVNGIAATPQDILRFDATSLGTSTAGMFSMYFDGIDVGFDTNAENIDALSLLGDGRILISTTGNPSVSGVSGADEDMLAFAPTSLGDATAGGWSLYFDGSDVGLADSSNEDVDAADVLSNGDIYLSTLGDFAVNGVSGSDEDVFICSPISTGDTTACNYSSGLYFDGSTWGFSSNDVDAFNFLALGPIATFTPTNTLTHTPTATDTPTAGPTPTDTPTPTITPTPTDTPTPGPTSTSTPTFTPSPTSPVPDLIFADDFESANLLAWTASSTNGGNLSVSPNAAMLGSYGMQLTFTNTTTMLIRDDSPNAEPRYRARFYFHPNSITMATGDNITLFQGLDVGGQVVLSVQFNRSSTSYQLRARVYDSGLATYVNIPYVNITDAAHSVEVDWGNDGYLVFWIDGVQKGSLTGINNSIYTVDRIRLGAPTLSITGTNGSFYIDAFESRRFTSIGS